MPSRTILQIWFITPLRWLRDYFSRPSEFSSEPGLQLDFRFSRPIMPCLKALFISVYCLVRLMFIVGVVSYPPALALRIWLLGLMGQLSGLSIESIGPLLLTTALGSLGGMLISLAFGLISGKTGIVSFLMIGAITADIPLGGTLGILQNVSSDQLGTLILLPLVAGSAAITGATVITAIRDKKLINLYEASKIFIVATGGVLIAIGGAFAMAHFHVLITLPSESENIWFLSLENLIVGFLLSYIFNSWKWAFGFMVLAIQIFFHTPTPSFMFLPAIPIFSGYLIGYFHLPISLYRCISMWWTYRKSRASAESNPSSPQVFRNLKHSALYRDERIRFPLPWLKKTLSIAVTQDRRQIQVQNAASPGFKNTIPILDYIVSKRPAQRSIAYTIIVDIMLSDLLSCNDFPAIAQASKQFLDDYLSRKPGLIHPDWITTFNDLKEVSKNARGYTNTNSKSQRQTFIDDMQVSLERIQSEPPQRLFSHEKQVENLLKITSTWMKCAIDKNISLRDTANKAGSLDNRYIPDWPFTDNDDDLSLCRHAIFDDLQQRFPPGEVTPEAYSPRLHIVGDAGTGKTSILYQLADKLRSRYLPIIYDLRDGMLDTEDILFNTLAVSIQKIFDKEKWNIRTFLPDNKTEIRHQFNRWLKQVEETLEQKKYTFILAFDNFEVPEASAHQKHSHSDLLLGWFNSLTQGYPRIILLLCGTQTSAEINKEWGECLAKFPILPVGMLNDHEAATLITYFAPKIADRQEFFETSVTQEIIHLTHGHPFLLQAFCATLINYLNKNKKVIATHQHVQAATQEFYKIWGWYFVSLWNSFDEYQKKCLCQLAEKGGRDSSKNLDHMLGEHPDSLHSTLSPLVQRELIRVDNQYYEITVPLLCKFIEHK